MDGAPASIARVQAAVNNVRVCMRLFLHAWSSPVSGSAFGTTGCTHLLGLCERMRPAYTLTTTRRAAAEQAHTPTRPNGFR